MNRDKNTLDSRLPLVQNADLDGKIVLVRFDHNVVKKGEIRDPYRIDRTFGTLYNIVERGGRPILMTHVGRPRDKKTGEITCRSGDAVEPIVEYLGEEYPLYYNSYEEAVEKLHDRTLLHAAHEYLKNCPTRKKLSGSYFRKSLEESTIYKSIITD